MTDAPFTETHRETLTDMATGAMPSWAALYATLHAALAEIDRLTTERNQIEQKAMEWCHATQEARAEIDRLTKALAVRGGAITIETLRAFKEQLKVKP